MPDIDWIIDDSTSIIVAKQEESYLVVEQGGSARYCIISYSPEGRMLFNGEDIETEAFMGFVGMIDTVNDSPNKRVLFNDDVTVVDL